MSEDNSFIIPTHLESVNKGAQRVDLQQLQPFSGAPNGSYIAAAGAATQTMFMWQDQVNWWLPSESYFSLRLKFTEGANDGITAIAPVTYCDNFAMTLFNRVYATIGNQTVDDMINPWIADTMLTYANAKRTFIKSNASATRVGEDLMTRLWNVKVTAAGGQAGVVEVAFRPPLSIFDTDMLPPGPQFQVNFEWASNIARAFESIQGDIAAGTAADQFQIRVDSFVFYKATAQPGNNTRIDNGGVIELSPAAYNSYSFTQNVSPNQLISLPKTTTKILLGFQDTNPAAVTYNTPPAIGTGINVPAAIISGVGTGFNPVTSFTTSFTPSTATSTNPSSAGLVKLQQMQLNLPELGATFPNPSYNFTSNADKVRAYSDFIHWTQGTRNQDEGSVPLGSDIIPTATGTGTSITWLGGTNLFQPGNTGNDQRFVVVGAGDGAGTPSTLPVVTSASQTCRWGWLGRCPGPIFAFPVVRPDNRGITQGTLNFTLSGAPRQYNLYVIATYTSILKIQSLGNGTFHYEHESGL